MFEWSKFDPLVEAVEVVLTERRELEARGPCLAILHRLWNPQTICAPGEEIAAVHLVSRTRHCQLRLSNRGKVMFDLLARNSHLGINSQQIADLTRSERFYVFHGSNGSCVRTLRCDLSRSSVRVYIDRLRKEIARAAAELQLTITPSNVIESLATNSRETLYRLRARVIWQHE
jgi:hypothetical protein